MQHDSIGAAVAKSLKPMIKSALINSGGYLGGAGATALGIPGSAPAMNGVGRALGARISRLIGSGDYAANTVSANSLIHSKGLSPQASFGGGLGSLRIKHREFIGDVSTSATAGAFSNNVYPINAGLSNTFPFLSSIATNYDQYLFHGLVFEFVSTTAGTASGAMGSIVLSADYNPNATAYQNKHVMENSGYAVSTRLDGSAMYGIECAKTDIPNQGYLVRNTSGVADLGNYDMGTFQVATVPSTGFAASSTVGELWVTYDVELRRPSLSPNRYGYCRLTKTSVTSATPLGSVSGAIIGYGACQAVVSPFSTRLEFPQTNTGDIFKVDIYWGGTTAAVVAYPALGYVGCSGLADAGGFTGAAGTAVVPAAGTTAQNMHMTFFVTITGADPIVPYVNFGLTGVYPTLSNSCVIIVTCVGSGYTASQL